MRGAGGLLLCIGDLLSDVGEAESSNTTSPSPSPCSPAASPSFSRNFYSTYVLLVGEDYNKLNEALAKGDHSWIALTPKLYGSLEMANTLLQSTNTNSRLLLEKIGWLDDTVKKGNSAVAYL